MNFNIKIFIGVNLKEYNLIQLMKQNNKLTLKQLQKELETLKKVNNSNTNELKSSIITRLFKQSSMLHLWLISGILGYARRIPFINKFVSLL